MVDWELLYLCILSCKVAYGYFKGRGYTKLSACTIEEDTQSIPLIVNIKTQEMIINVNIIQGWAEDYQDRPSTNPDVSDSYLNLL